jgi:hypothetical protein
MIEAYNESILVQSNTAPIKKHSPLVDGEAMRECCKVALCENDYSDRRILSGIVLSATTHKDYPKLNVNDIVYYKAYSADAFTVAGNDIYHVNYYDILAVERAA